MEVTIIGSGNVGAAFGKALLKNRHNVMFYDVVDKQLSSPLKFTQDFNKAFEHADALVICVPTELNAEGKCDMNIFQSVCEQFGELMQNSQNRRLLVQKSTSPPGTASQMISLLEKKYNLLNGTNYDYVVFPSFLNMSDPEGDELKQVKCLVGLHDSTNQTSYPYQQMQKLLHWTDPKFASYITVEFAKYTNQILHASIISIWNELYLLGEKLDADTDWIARGVCVGRGLESFYRVHGKAWGGHCLPKDTQVFLDYAISINHQMPILESVIKVNEAMAQKKGIRKEHWTDIYSSSPSSQT